MPEAIEDVFNLQYQKKSMETFTKTTNLNIVGTKSKDKNGAWEVKL
jgi:hypothetical protein